MTDESGNGSSRMRPKSRDTGFRKLRAMKCFPEVHQRLIEGWGLMELAKYVQDDRKEYLQATQQTLIHTLKEYRATIPPAQLIEKRMPSVFNRAAEKLEKGVDEVYELEKLVVFQKRRMKIDGNTEKRIGKLLPTMTQEIRTMREVLRTLVDVKMDLGLSKRHLGELNIDATLIADVAGRYGSQSVAKVLQDPQSRQKVMGVAEKFLALAAASDPDSGIPDDTELEVDDEAGEVIDVGAVPVEEPK